jgi:AraC-like DNA-binding protein/mannose-6-phosphate isomerase-like protein (cupin superfamily)
MYPDMLHEQVIYQNPFLAMRIWQLGSEYNGDKKKPQDRSQERNQNRKATWHYHGEVEFLLILKGELTAFYGEQQLVLRKGDIALFGSSEPHWTIRSKDSAHSYIVLQIDLRKYWDFNTLNCMKHFSEVIRPLSALNYIYIDNRDVRSQTAKLIREIYKEMNDAQIGYEFAVSSRIKSILLLLLRNDNRLHLNYTGNRLLERIQPALDYIEQHLSDKLTIQELSKLLNMSYTYFIKTFKQAIGMSFTDFIIYKRIKKAEQLLLTTDRSIAEIAELAGITNLGHFYELFRRYNTCSPKQFKDRLREPYVNSDPSHSFPSERHFGDH